MNKAEPLTILSRVKQLANGCWEWTWARFAGQGYGAIHVAGKQLHAHRFAWTVFKGPIPDGLLVLHKCDNPPCCNPDHLYLGTHKDNMRDMVARGRTGHRGESGRLQWAKIFPSDVRKIRRMYATGKYFCWEIAEDYGLSQHTVADIVAYRRWKSVK